MSLVQGSKDAADHNLHRHYLPCSGLPHSDDNSQNSENGERRSGETTTLALSHAKVPTLVRVGSMLNTQYPPAGRSDGNTIRVQQNKVHQRHRIHLRYRLQSHRALCTKGSLEKMTVKRRRDIKEIRSKSAATSL